MAVPTGSGTETVHSHMFEDLDASSNIIVGVQHHVYTVISVICYCNALNATTDKGYVEVKGHSGHQGTSNVGHAIFSTGNTQVGETFVWNDKFSFNGYEPAGTNVFSAAEQILIAAQGGSVAQTLFWSCDSSADDFDVIVTYLDQDWS